MVASADHRATRAGVDVLDAGGNAVDAAIATNAVLAVVGPHLCGLGGDLFAIVYADGRAHALNASGRAGTGADADRLRADGHRVMPFRHDVRAVTIPGCVDGWVALHDRFGTVPLVELLRPARRLADRGFEPSPGLRRAVAALDRPGRVALAALVAAVESSRTTLLPGLTRALDAIADGGRDGFYSGEFGAGLIELGAGLFAREDLDQPQADWHQTLSAPLWGMDLHTTPGNSQGYLTLGAARLAERIGLPAPEDPGWAHLLIECARAAGRDRHDVLHEHADSRALLATIDDRLDEVDPDRAGSAAPPTRSGDTTYLCVVDADQLGVSLIQSNAAGLGSWLAEPNTGINLHNRGLGFSLEPGHVAELAPGRRPPHTLAPLLATQGGRLRAVLGTMGGDAQPQILLQLLARLFDAGQDPAQAVTAGRWILRSAESGFDTWTSPGTQTVQLEGHTPPEWHAGLGARGQRVEAAPEFDSAFGHAHVVLVDPEGGLGGYADPRTEVGSCLAADEAG